MRCEQFLKYMVILARFNRDLKYKNNYKIPLVNSSVLIAMGQILNSVTLFLHWDD